MQKQLTIHNWQLKILRWNRRFMNPSSSNLPLPMAKVHKSVGSGRGCNENENRWGVGSSGHWFIISPCPNCSFSLPKLQFGALQTAVFNCKNSFIIGLTKFYQACDNFFSHRWQTFFTTVIIFLSSPWLSLIKLCQWCIEAWQIAFEQCILYLYATR